MSTDKIRFYLNSTVKFICYFLTSIEDQSVDRFSASLVGPKVGDPDRTAMYNISKSPLHTLIHPEISSDFVAAVMMCGLHYSWTVSSFSPLVVDVF